MAPLICRSPRISSVCATGTTATAGCSRWPRAHDGGRLGAAEREPAREPEEIEGRHLQCACGILPGVPPEDIETLRAEYELLNRNDWEGAFASAPADFALKTPAESGPYGGAATSREGARRVYGEFFAGFDEVEFEAEEFFDHDGWVLVHIVMRARPPGASATIERRGADLWTMQDGRPVRLDIFTDREEAEKAVEKIRRAHQRVL
jgi:ketosteroid isomerase-like protein